MNQDAVRVHQVQWLRALPLFRLFQAVPLGCRVSALLLSAMMIGITWAGSAAIHNACVDSKLATAETSELLHAFPWTPYDSLRQTDAPYYRDFSLSDIFHAVPGPLNTLARTTFRLFVPAADFGRRSRQTSSATSRWILPIALLLWNAMVVGVFGTAIARSTATRFCRQTRTGFLTSAKTALRRFAPIAVTIGIMLLLLTFMRTLIGIAQVVEATGSAGGIVVSVFWPFVILVSACLVMALGVLGFAWMLSLSAIATDGCPGSDALSRCISYVLSHRLFTLVSVSLIAGLSLATRFAATFLLLIAELALPSGLVPEEPDRIRAFWEFLLSLVPHAAQLSVIIAGVTIAYILLRQQEDGVALESIDGAIAK